MNMAKNVVHYTTADGKCPVREFLDSLSGKEAQKVTWTMQLLERLDRVPTQYFKKLVNTEEIWECRVETASGAYRVFSFFWHRDTVVFTNGYSKKTQKTDPKEIERAERYRRDYLIRHGRNSHA